MKNRPVFLFLIFSLQSYSQNLFAFYCEELQIIIENFKLKKDDSSYEEARRRCSLGFEKGITYYYTSTDGDRDELSAIIKAHKEGLSGTPSIKHLVDQIRESPIPACDRVIIAGSPRVGTALAETVSDIAAHTGFVPAALDTSESIPLQNIKNLAKSCKFPDGIDPARIVSGKSLGHGAFGEAIRVDILSDTGEKKSFTIKVPLFFSEAGASLTLNQRFPDKIAFKKKFNGQKEVENITALHDDRLPSSRHLLQFGSFQDLSGREGSPDDRALPWIPSSAGGIGIPCIVMNTVEGKQLRDEKLFSAHDSDFLSCDTNVEKFKTVFRGLVEGLKDLQEKKMIHSDIKDDNIIIQPDGTPVLIDMGGSISFENCEKHIDDNKAGLPFGSNAFSNPAEIDLLEFKNSSGDQALKNLKKELYCSEKKDSFGMGATLLYLLGGKEEDPTAANSFKPRLKDGLEVEAMKRDLESQTFLLPSAGDTPSMQMGMMRAKSGCNTAVDGPLGSDGPKFFEVVKRLIDPNPYARWTGKQAFDYLNNP